MENQKTLGFIVLRHVQNTLTDQYWQTCCKQIRKFYPNSHIVIIDDNSNKQYVSQCDFLNVTIIESEFKGRGEFLPYYYYLKHKLFDCAVILHDSVFIQQKIDFYTDTYMPLWHFDHNVALQGQQTDINDILQLYEKYDLKNKFYAYKCNGIFGGMTSISHSFLVGVNDKYDLSLLIPKIVSRHNRCSFERVLACLLFFYGKDHGAFRESILGDILKYCEWGITYDQIHTDKTKNLPVIKIWTGR